MNSPTNDAKEHTFSTNTNNAYEAIRQTSEALNNFVLQALASHECSDVEECEFETYARDLLGMFERHAEYLSDDPLWRGEEDEGGGLCK